MPPGVDPCICVLLTGTGNASTGTSTAYSNNNTSLTEKLRHFKGPDAYRNWCDLDCSFCCLDNFLISANEFSRQRGSETHLCAVGRSLVMAGEESNSSARARAHKSISHVQYSPIVFQALMLNLTTLLVGYS
jgi:hypothetical protein